MAKLEKWLLIQAALNRASNLFGFLDISGTSGIIFCKKGSGKQSLKFLLKSVCFRCIQDSMCTFLHYPHLSTRNIMF